MHHDFAAAMPYLGCMRETLAAGLSLRVKVAEALALADALGETSAALHLNVAHMALGGTGVVPPEWSSVLALINDPAAPDK